MISLLGDLVIAYRINFVVIVPKAFRTFHDQCSRITERTLLWNACFQSWKVKTTLFLFSEVFWKNYWSLSLSRAVSQLIMRVKKPTVAYKLAELHSKNPKGEAWPIITKTNTRLISASKKSRHEIQFYKLYWKPMTKRVKYTAIWKQWKIIIIFFAHGVLIRFDSNLPTLLSVCLSEFRVYK